MFWLYPNSKNREEVRKQRIRCPYDPVTGECNALQNHIAPPPGNINSIGRDVNRIGYFIRYTARKPASLVLQDESGRDSIFLVLRENTTR